MGHAYWIVAPALVLALAGCDKKPAAEDPSGDKVTMEAPDIKLPAAITQPDDARSYLDKAAAGDSFEIQSSQAILKTTANKDIKDFARMMITAHEKSTKDLKAASDKIKLAAGSPTLTTEQQSNLDKLAAARGTDADKMYLDMQRDAHKDALDLHKHYASDGDTPSLKAVAATIAPVVQSHLDALDKLPSPSPAH